MARRIGVIAALAAALFVSTGVARAEAPVDLFDGVGLFIDNPMNFPDAPTLAAQLKAAHFTWVAFHVDDVGTLDWTPPSWLHVMRDNGIEVGAWGAEGLNPIASAAVADLAVRTYGFDFYIADAEGPYEKTKAANGYWRSSMFVREFRALQPTIPSALVTLGAAKAPWVLPIDFAAWRNAGFDLLPEAYYNQYPGYRPDLTVAHAQRAGWALSAVHPVIGVYHHYPAARYVPLLQSLGTRGFSVFLGDQMSAADFTALAGIAASTVAAG
jgi:hypothetical protein